MSSCLLKDNISNISLRLQIFSPFFNFTLPFDFFFGGGNGLPLYTPYTYIETLQAVVLDDSGNSHVYDSRTHPVIFIGQALAGAGCSVRIRIRLFWLDPDPVVFEFVLKHITYLFLANIYRPQFLSHISNIFFLTNFDDYKLRGRKIEGDFFSLDPDLFFSYPGKSNPGPPH